MGANESLSHFGWLNEITVKTICFKKAFNFFDRKIIIISNEKKKYFWIFNSNLM